MGEILVEVLPARPSGELAPPRPAVPEEFSRRSTEIADSVVDVAERFRSRLDDRMRAADQSQVKGWRLDQVELSFQLAVQAEAGVIIAKATAGATFAAKLVWKATADGG